MRYLNLPLLAIFLAAMLFASTGLPDRGDPEAPSNVHVTPYYIEQSVTDMETPNVVTAVLLDYRGYDTFGETIVIFTAGLVCLLILWKGRRRSVPEDHA